MRKDGGGGGDGGREAEGGGGDSGDDGGGGGGSGGDGGDGDAATVRSAHGSWLGRSAPLGAVRSSSDGLTHAAPALALARWRASDREYLSGIDD
eukprot:6108851-Prymnesium_polylepis.2